MEQIPATIELKLGSVFDSFADIIIIPRSTTGTISPAFIDELEHLNVPLNLRQSELGTIEQEFIQKKNLGTTDSIIYATSVDSYSKTFFSTIRILCKSIAEYSAHEHVNTIAMPLLGTGAGGLDKASVYVIMTSTLHEFNRGNCKYQIYDIDKKTYTALLNLSQAKEPSLLATFREIVKEERHSPFLQEIINAKDFYFEEARKKFQAFLHFQEPMPGFFKKLKDTPIPEKFSFQGILDQFEESSKEREFVTLIGILIAHIDSKAYNKNTWNNLPDKRTLAHSGVRQKNWIDNLLRYKIEQSLERISPSIANAISFLLNPAKELTMLSVRHRESVMNSFFGAQYYDKEDLGRLFNFCENYLQVTNHENEGAAISRLLYVRDVKNLWGPANQKDEDDENEVNQSNDEPKSLSETSETAKIFRRRKSRPFIQSDVYAEVDMLDYELYAHCISQFIKHKDTKPPLTIGIMAPWGKGKTTMMRFVQTKLEGKKKEKEIKKENPTYKTFFSYLGRVKKEKLPSLQYPTVWFNAWKFQKSEQVWAGLAFEIMQQLVDKLPQQSRELFWLKLHLKRVDIRKVKKDLVIKLLNAAAHKFLSLSGACSLIIALLLLLVASQIEGLAVVFQKIGYTLSALSLSLFGICGSFIKALKENISVDLTKYIQEPDYKEKMGFFYHVEHDLQLAMELLIDRKAPAVIFIDDLDRCSPKTVAEVIEAINLFVSGNFPDCFFILGQDGQMVAAALDVAYKDVELRLRGLNNENGGSLGWFFMQKFIQLQFNLPGINNEQTKRYMASLLDYKEIKEELPEEKINEIKQTAEQQLAEVTQFIDAYLDDNNLSKISAQIDELASRAAYLPTGAIVSMKELLIDRSADDFSEDDTNIKDLVERFAEYLGDSPRLIKQFVNTYRFYHFLQFSRVNIKLAETNHFSIGRWLILMVKWPQVIRCIQWNLEFNFLVTSNSKSRASEFEDLLLKADSYEEWKKDCTDKGNRPNWITDRLLFDFIRSTKDCDSLSQAVEVGFW